MTLARVASWRRARLFAPGLWALLLSACSGGPAREPLDVDCSVEDDYEFQSVQFFEPGDNPPWFDYGDPSAGSFRSFSVVEIPGGRCGSNGALQLIARGHKDWGAGFGEYNTALMPVVATDYEGVSFWARVTGYGTSTGFQLTLQDRNTHPDGAVCMEAGEDQIASGQYTVNEAGMTVPVGGDLPGATDCGNGFITVVTGQRDWFLHRIPFEAFRQTPQPNLIPTGVDRTGLYQFTVVIPKDSNIEILIDNLAVYRRRAAAETAEADDPTE